jgi:hypothetical protein
MLANAWFISRKLEDHDQRVKPEAQRHEEMTRTTRTTRRWEDDQVKRLRGDDSMV